MSRTVSTDKYRMLDIKDIVSRKNDLDVGRYIVSEYAKILKGMSIRNREKYCAELAESV